MDKEIIVKLHKNFEDCATPLIVLPTPTKRYKLSFSRRRENDLSAQKR